MRACMPCVCTMYMLVPTEVRLGCRIPWNYSYGRLWATSVGAWVSIRATLTVCMCIYVWVPMSHGAACASVYECPWATALHVHLCMSAREPRRTRTSQDSLQSWFSPYCGSLGIRTGEGLYPVSPLAVWHPAEWHHDCFILIWSLVPCSSCDG